MTPEDRAVACLAVWRLPDGTIDWSQADTDIIPRLLDTRIVDAIRAAVAEETERCVVLMEGLTKIRIPEPFRNADLFIGEDADGWRLLTASERQLLKSVAAAIRARGGK